MTKVHVKYECRNPVGLCSITPEEQYRIALEQIRWADETGFGTVNFCEHHGAVDGYLPSPLTMAAAAAAVTDKIKLRINIVMPYHDPLRVAEDMAIVDIISGGRTEIAVLGGYVPSEFEMFGAQLNERGDLIEEGVAVLKQAWTGEEFEYRGRRARVTPRPSQRPRPTILIGGGIARAGRRAAHIADAFIPMFPDAYAAYADECEKLGKTPQNEGKIGAGFLFIAKDPDAYWQKIAGNALYETNCYARWQAETGVTGMFEEMTDADQLRQSGTFKVLTPEQCLAMAEELGSDGQLLLHPLMGGMDPELGWQSLRLFAEEVIPHLDIIP